MRLELISSSLHTDLLNLRTKQPGILVMSVVRSGNCRNWMWDHVIQLSYTWGCHPTFHTLLWGWREGSPSWATSDHVPKDYCTLTVAFTSSLHGGSPSAAAELVCWKSGHRGLLVPSSASLQLPHDWNPLMFPGAWGHCWLLVIVTFALWTKSRDFDMKFSLGSHQRPCKLGVSPQEDP